MDTETRLAVAIAEGIANGWLVQTEHGIRLTPKGMAYAEELWTHQSDLERLLLAGYLKKATPDV